MANIVIPSEATPLAWPPHVPRTPAQQRQRSLFRTKSVAIALTAVQAELRRLKATGMIISSNLPARQNGAPSVRDQGVVDVGVAVYWVLANTQGDPVPYCLPCDRWRTVGENLLAIARTIKALRDVERWGAIRTEQAFAGVKALPAGSETESVDWRAIIGGAQAWPELPPEDLLALARARYRRASQAAHPDRGGDAEVAQLLNRAMAAAAAELELKA